MSLLMTGLAAILLIAAIFVVLFAILFAVGTIVFKGTMAMAIIAVLTLFAIGIAASLLYKVSKRDKLEWWHYAFGTGLPIVMLVMAWTYMQTIHLPFIGAISRPAAVGSPLDIANSAVVDIAGPNAILVYGALIALVCFAGAFVLKPRYIKDVREILHI